MGEHFDAVVRDADVGTEHLRRAESTHDTSVVIDARFCIGERYAIFGNIGALKGGAANLIKAVEATDLEVSLKITEYMADTPIPVLDDGCRELNSRRAKQDRLDRVVTVHQAAPGAKRCAEPLRKYTRVLECHRLLPSAEKRALGCVIHVSVQGPPGFHIQRRRYPDRVNQEQGLDG